jgi:hypothetical protein
MAGQRVTKRQLTVAEAADQWIRCKRKIAELKPELDEAAAVLKSHFEKTGRKTYKDRIAYAVTTRTRLDTDKVREFLGKRYKEFTTRTEVRSLSLLGDD